MLTRVKDYCNFICGGHLTRWATPAHTYCQRCSGDVPSAATSFQHNCDQCLAVCQARRLLLHGARPLVACHRTPKPYQAQRALFSAARLFCCCRQLCRQCPLQPQHWPALQTTHLHAVAQQQDSQPQWSHCQPTSWSLQAGPQTGAQQAICSLCASSHLCHTHNPSAPGLCALTPAAQGPQPLQAAPEPVLQAGHLHRLQPLIGLELPPQSLNLA